MTLCFQEPTFSYVFGDTGVSPHLVGAFRLRAYPDVGVRTFSATLGVSAFGRGAFQLGAYPDGGGWRTCISRAVGRRTQKGGWEQRRSIGGTASCEEGCVQALFLVGWASGGVAGFRKRTERQIGPNLAASVLHWRVDGGRCAAKGGWTSVLR